MGPTPCCLDAAKSGDRVGVHITGAHTSDLIAEGALATRMNVTVMDLASASHAHTTLSGVLREVTFKANCKSLYG